MLQWYNWKRSGAALPQFIPNSRLEWKKLSFSIRTHQRQACPTSYSVYMARFLPTLIQQLIAPEECICHPCVVGWDWTIFILWHVCAWASPWTLVATGSWPREMPNTNEILLSLNDARASLTMSLSQSNEYCSVFAICSEMATTRRSTYLCT